MLKKILVTVMLTALLVVPAAAEISKELMDEIVEWVGPDVKTTLKIQTRVGKVMFQEKEAEPAPAVAKADKDRGYILFVRDMEENINYNSAPKKSELKDTLDTFCPLGSRKASSFAIYPLAGLGKVSVTFSDLKSAEGNVIPKQSISTRAAKYLGKFRGGIIHIEERLFVNTPVECKEGITRRFLFTVNVPLSAKPGDYSCEITVKPESKPASKLNYKLKVMPFTLEVNPNFSTGWYYLPGSDAKILEEDMQNMVEYGFNAAIAPGGSYSKAGGSDFSDLDKYYAAAKKTGMIGIHQVWSPSIPGKMFTPDYNQAYVAHLTNLVKWADAHKDFNYVYWVTDEPREVNDTGFNLNFAQTMQLINMCKQIKGLKITVTLMSDGEKGTDYTSMVPLLDIMQMHHNNKWGPKIIALGRKLNNYCTYNSGTGRWEYGFHSWRIGSRGKYEWHWQWSGNIFDPTFSQYVYVFRSKLGLHTSPTYERSSEGAVDYKYLYTLDKRVKAALAGSDDKKKKTAGEAKAYLDGLYSKIPDFEVSKASGGADAGADVSGMTQLEGWRWKLAQYLAALN